MRVGFGPPLRGAPAGLRISRPAVNLRPLTPGLSWPRLHLHSGAALILQRALLLALATLLLAAAGLTVGLLLGWGIGELGMLLSTPGYHPRGPETTFLKLLNL